MVDVQTARAPAQTLMLHVNILFRLEMIVNINVYSYIDHVMSDQTIHYCSKKGVYIDEIQKLILKMFHDEIVPKDQLGQISLSLSSDFL